jgi:hypothetical protein
MCGPTRAPARKRIKVMNTTHDIKTKRLIGALGVAAAAAVAPALLFAGAGTAHADDPCYGELAFSFYCSPGSHALDPAPAAEPASPNYPPLPNPYSILPQCTYGVLDALDGNCS